MIPARAAPRVIPAGEPTELLSQDIPAGNPRAAS